MKRGEALRLLGEQAADQWGLVTAAQARTQGVDQVTLLRLCDAGLLRNMGRGVYLVTGAVPPEHLDIRVAWLRLDPQKPTWERRKPESDNGVVSHRSACLLFKLGDIPAPEVELTVPRRRTTRQAGVRLHRGALAPSEVTVVDGLPVTTIERTVVDLLHTRADGGHVGGVIADAEHRGMLDLDRLAERVAPFGATYGMPSASGGDLLRALVSQGGQRLRSDEMRSAVGEAALAGFLAGLDPSLAAAPALPELRLLRLWACYLLACRWQSRELRTGDSDAGCSPGA
jgi:hypothetical protein